MADGSQGCVRDGAKQEMWILPSYNILQFIFLQHLSFLSLFIIPTVFCIPKPLHPPREPNRLLNSTSRMLVPKNIITFWIQCYLNTISEHCVMLSLEDKW